MADDSFDLADFTPYLLNQAAEITSLGFQVGYRKRYGMTRTQWRVMANLGKFGAMTASRICTVSMIEKTKVSRAVAALAEKGWLERESLAEDRRAEALSLTPAGVAVFQDLGKTALEFDASICAKLGAQDAAELHRILRALIAAETGE